MEKLLILNPGSTSTKIAYYEGTTEIWKESITHSREEIAKYANIPDQLDMRYNLILDAMNKHGVEAKNLTAVVSRGGPIAPFKSGGYIVNQAMVDKAANNPQDAHASNVGCMIAFKMAQENGYNAYIYDAVTVDEVLPEYRITGHPDMERVGQGHNLNMRAAALKYCKENGKDYAKSTLIVVHLGGGISVSLQKDGLIADIVNDEDGTFAPERAGSLPMVQFMKYCYSHEQKDTYKMLKGKGGIVAHLGTNDSREVEKMIEDGDKHAELVYKAMAINVAKAVGREAVLAPKQIEQIVLTGGIAYSKMFTQWIKDAVDWIAPVTVIPGENEMIALAEGACRIIRGEEEAHVYEG